MFPVAPTLTNQGMSLIIRSEKGDEKITFTRFKIGDGTLPLGKTQRDMTDLAHVMHSFSINSIDSSVGQGSVKIIGTFDSSDLESDFTWRELGLYARGEDNSEVLYAYANCGDDGGTLRALSPDVSTEQTVIFIVSIGQTSNFTAIAAPRDTYAAAADLAYHIADHGNPHFVDKNDIGLGNVQNYAPSSMPISFVATTAVGNLRTGETLGTLMGKIAKAISAFIEHADNKQNPHKVAASDIGLENVVNAAPKDMEIPFSVASENGVPASGETMATIMGKVAKSLTSLLSHLENKNNPHEVVLSDIAVTGTYTGTGVQKRLIELDFTPSAVVLYNEYGQTFDASKGVCGGLATSGRGVRIPASTSANDATTWSNSYTALMVTTNGFYVNYLAGTVANDSVDTNESNVVYHYIAYK